MAMFDLNAYSSNDNMATVPVNQLDMFDKQMHDYKMKTDKGYRQVEEFKANTNNQALEDTSLDFIPVGRARPRANMMMSSDDLVADVAAKGVRKMYSTGSRDLEFANRFLMRRGDDKTLMLDSDKSPLAKIVKMAQATKMISDRDGFMIPKINAGMILSSKNKELSKQANDVSKYSIFAHEMKHAKNADMPFTLSREGRKEIPDSDEYGKYITSDEELSAFGAQNDYISRNLNKLSPKEREIVKKQIFNTEKSIITRNKAHNVQMVDTPFLGKSGNILKNLGTHSPSKQRKIVDDIEEKKWDKFYEDLRAKGFTSA